MSDALLLIVAALLAVVGFPILVLAVHGAMHRRHHRRMNRRRNDKHRLL